MLHARHHFLSDVTALVEGDAVEDADPPAVQRITRHERLGQVVERRIGTVGALADAGHKLVADELHVGRIDVRAHQAVGKDRPR
mgnify:CR=1 FL=1